MHADGRLLEGGRQGDGRNNSASMRVRFLSNMNGLGAELRLLRRFRCHVEQEQLHTFQGRSPQLLTRCFMLRSCHRSHKKKRNREVLRLVAWTQSQNTSNIR